MSEAGRSRLEVPLLPVEERVFYSDVVCIGRFVCPPTHRLFRDSGPATSYCVAFPRRGVWIRHRDDDAFVADSTLATLYNRGDEYQRGKIDARGDHCDWFAVAPDVLLDLAASHDAHAYDDPQRPFRAHRAPCDQMTYLLQRLLFESVARGGEPDVLRVEEKALSIVDQLLRNARPPKRRRRRPSREVVETTRAVLATRFAERLTVRQLAAHVGTSPFHLCHAFKATTGSTIARHRDRLRVQAALELLLNRGPSNSSRCRGHADDGRHLVDTALELGFCSHSHFTLAFRRAFRTTPSDFRRKFA